MRCAHLPHIQPEPEYTTAQAGRAAITGHKQASSQHRGPHTYAHLLRSVPQPQFVCDCRASAAIQPTKNDTTTTATTTECSPHTCCAACQSSTPADQPAPLPKTAAAVHKQAPNLHRGLHTYTHLLRSVPELRIGRSACTTAQNSRRNRSPPKPSSSCCIP
jgi:hypothetical protein